MDPEMREFVIRSMSNLWIFEGIFIKRLVLTLANEALLSEATLRRMLEGIDAECSALDGEDDREFATRLLATARSALADPA